MSFRQEKRDKIQRYILEKISQKQPAIVKKQQKLLEFL